jgi:hypothetical protein
MIKPIQNENYFNEDSIFQKQETNEQPTEIQQTKSIHSSNCEKKYEINNRQKSSDDKASYNAIDNEKLNDQNNIAQSIDEDG